MRPKNNASKIAPITSGTYTAGSVTSELRIPDSHPSISTFSKLKPYSGHKSVLGVSHISSRIR